MFHNNKAIMSSAAGVECGGGVSRWVSTTSLAVALAQVDTLCLTDSHVIRLMKELSQKCRDSSAASDGSGGVTPAEPESAAGSAQEMAGVCLEALRRLEQQLVDVVRGAGEQLVEAVKGLEETAADKIDLADISLVATAAKQFLAILAERFIHLFIYYSLKHI